MDAYIARARPFARPILEHLRRLVHAHCPEVREAVTWGFPHFEYRGRLCSMAAFDDHVAFGFQKASSLADLLPGGAGGEGRVGQFGKIRSLESLPSEAALGRLIRRAAALNEEERRLPRRSEVRPRAIRIPPYFTRALREHPEARATFEGFDPAHQFEYVEWVTGARVPATRDRRLSQAVEWLTQGKTRHWRRNRP